ncbi:MAG: c-type cytochrome [Acidobacteriota bacterium]|nr:c-type cytochrome [Acidobacteriota bacterium]
MNRIARYCVTALCVGGMSLLFATGQSAPPPAGSSPGAPPAGPRVPQKPRNLKVLPEDTDLRKVMRQYSGDLGVECEFCHAAPDPVTHRSDRASDANPVKETARYMIRMTDDLNAKYLANLPEQHHDHDNPITCGTCHRGEKHPSVFVAPPRQEGNRPPGAPPAAAPSSPPPGF